MQHTVQDGFPYYIELLGNANYQEAFTSDKYFELLNALNEDQAKYRYAADKWSIKQIVGHITDHERIMVYRCLRFSRNDKTLLPGYDQNLFVDNGRFDELSIHELIIDLQQVRAASNSFIKGLSEAQLNLTGVAWKYELTVADFLKATIGHELHHMNIIQERYLNLNQ